MKYLRTAGGGSFCLNIPDLRFILNLEVFQDLLIRTYVCAFVRFIHLYNMTFNLAFLLTDWISTTYHPHLALITHPKSMGGGPSLPSGLHALRNLRLHEKNRRINWIKSVIRKLKHESENHQKQSLPTSARKQKGSRIPQWHLWKVWSKRKLLLLTNLVP